MAGTDQITAWIALFTGLYSLGAAMGELRKPGSWTIMLEDFGQNNGLRFLTGILVLALGATIYLVNPWNPADWLAVLVTVMGGGMVLEGFVILSFGQPFMRFATSLIGIAGRSWAMLAAVLGVALIAVALMRL